MEETRAKADRTIQNSGISKAMRGVQKFEEQKKRSPKRKTSVERWLDEQEDQMATRVK